MKGKHLLLKALMPCAGVLLAVLPSCNNLDFVEDYSSDEVREVSLIARLEQTKTANNGNSTVWVSDDALSIIIRNTGTDNCYKKRFNYDAESGAFKGTVGRNELAANNDWFAMYPYREENGDPSDFSLTIPATQTQIGNSTKTHFAGEGFPLYGKVESFARGSQAPSIQMNQILAGVQFNFTNESDIPVIVKEIVFTASHPISGNFSADLTGEDIVLSTDGLTSNSSTLNVQEGETIPVNGSGTFSLGVMPFVAANAEQLKVKVTTVNANTSEEVVFYHVYNISAGTKFTHGRIKGVTVGFDTEHQTDPQGIVKSAQTLSFDNGTVSWTLGDTYAINGSYNPQGVTGALTPVTYSSSDATVATILDNKIIIKGAGTTTITAAAAETEAYYSATASYSLTIQEGTTPPAPSEPEGYTLITSEPSDWSGRYIFVSADKNYVFTGDNGTSNKKALSASDFDGNTITASGLSGYEFTISKSGSNYYLKHNNQYLYVSYSGNGDTGIGYSSSQEAVNCKMGNDNTFLFWKNDGSYDQTLYYKSSSNYFKFGGSSNNTGVLIYKYGEGGGDTPSQPELQDQTLTFGSSQISWTVGTDCEVGGSYNPQSVNGAQTTVSYSSSNASVATISNGKIVINGTGSTTITATAASSSTYNAASASYTLTVNAKPSVKTYAKITSNTATLENGTYLIVNANNNYALTSTGTQAKTAVSPSSNVIASNDLSDCEFVITSVSGGYTIKQANGSNYLVRDTGNSTNYIAYSTSSCVFAKETKNSDLFCFKATNQSDNKTTEYLYYNSSGYFKIGGSGAPTKDGAGVILYKLDGSGSVTPGQDDDPVVNPGSGDYAKISTEPSSWEGYYLVVDEASSKVFAPLSSYASSYAYSVTINNGVITGNTDLAKFAITITDAGKDHANDNLSGQRAYNFKNSEGKYIYWSSDFGALSQAEIHIKDTNIATNDGTDYEYYHAFKIVSGGVQFVSAINTSGGNAYYLGYSDSKFTYNTTSSNKVQLYKLNGSVSPQPGKQDQTLTFGSSQVTWTVGTNCEIGGSYNPQSVNGAQTTVSYSSSNTNVATISNGKIVINGTGSTTITATAASNSTYNAGSASYTLTVKAQSSTKTYAKITSNTATLENGTYLIVNANNNYALTSTGTQAKTAVSPSSNVIASNDLSNCEFTITSVSGGYTIKQANGSNYLVRDTGNSTNYIAYSTSSCVFAKETKNSDLFCFKATNQSDNKTTEYLYYNSSGYFKIGGSGAPTKDGAGVILYKLDGSGSVTPEPGKQDQALSFASSSLSWAIGDNYKVGSSYAIQTLSGAKTSVTYSSSNTSVATISNGQIKIVGPGSTTITATAAASDTYNSATASYTLIITQEGAFNLENDYLSSYLTAAEAQYTNSTSNSIVSNYAGSYSWGGSDSYPNTMDLPKPVTLAWTGSATSISIYEGTSTSGTAFKTMTLSNATSADVYNLIPGRNYTYRTSNGQTGTFSTTGRRRMIKVSDSASQNHARNCRDLGGIATRAGQNLKYGLMYRGTNMDSITSDEKNILLNELGIKLDQDLRGEKSSSPLGSGVKFSNERYDASTIQNQNGSNMKTTVNDVLTSVINGNPVYIHCYIGSDRTGHMCMLYEALLGCDLKECDIDYEITSFAKSMVSGLRTRGSGNESSFRSKFVVSPYNADSVPESVEKYVTGTLGIDISVVKAYRKAMGVNETL